MATLVSKPTGWLRPDPGQPRKQFDEGDLRSLGASLLEQGQLQPVGARPDGTLLWGERRWRAAQLVGLPELSVVLTDRVLDESEIRLCRLAENLHRADLSVQEKHRAFGDLLAANPGWDQRTLADKLSLDPSSVTRVMALGRCAPAVQQAVADGRLRLADMYEISKSAAADQPALLALKLGGATRADLQRAVRATTAASAPPAARTRRVTLPLSVGTTVTVAGDGLDLDAVHEALAAASREVRHAKDKFLTVKTLEQTLKDRRKAAKGGNS